jgi:Zn-dependent protease with chaperone function
MARSDEKIRARLDWLEREARERPRLHALRLVGLVALGYLYPLALLGVSFSLVLLLLWLAPAAWKAPRDEVIVLYVAALIGSLVLAALIVRTFFVTLPDPPGHPLAPGDAAPLRQLAEELRLSVNAPPIHHIHLDERLNAAVAQRPKFGFWGPRTNYLIVGVPLLLALTREQFRAVLLHEIEHLSARHNSFSAWIYRVQSTWQTMAEPFKAVGWLRRIVMGWFVEWYGAHFATSTLALRRRHEYEADRRMAQSNTPLVAAHTLMTMDWASYLMDKRFWPGVLREAATHPLPPADIMGRLAEFFATEPDAGLLSRWLARERLARTPITSEHPSLGDRVNAMGQRKLLDTDWPGESAPQHAAIELLGDSRQRLLGVINASWKAMAIGRWRMEHAVAKEIAEKAAKTPVPDEADATKREWERVQADVEYAPPELAHEKLREFLSRFPQHAGANFTLGRMLLEQDDERAAGHVETAMKNGSEYIAPGLNMLLAYYRQTGRDAEADPIRTRLEQHEADMSQARRERQTVRRRDRFAPHGLPTADVEKICRILRRYPRVLGAYLVRKEVRLFSDKPGYVLAITRQRYLMEDNSKADKHLINCLQAEIEQPCAVVVLGWGKRRLRSRLLQACPAPIFSTGK